MKKKKFKKREKCNVHNIFHNTFTKILSNRLLQLVIDGKKIIIVVSSNRKQEAT